MSRRGRPPGTTKAFLSDPDRFAIAFFDMLKVAGVSETKARLLVAGIFFGRPAEPPAVPTMAKNRKKVAAGWMTVSYRTPVTVSIAGKASTILKKAQRATSDRELNWRSTLAAAYWLAFFRRDLPFAQLRESIRILCASAGEPLFADVLLRTMIAREGLPTELYSTVREAQRGIDGTGRNAFELIEAPRDPDRP